MWTVAPVNALVASVWWPQMELAPCALGSPVKALVVCVRSV